MKKIGLIGGMSFESSLVYYRMINEQIRDRLGKLHSAEVILRSVDFQRIVDLQKADRWEEAGRELAGIAASLEDAGADCVLICTNTMHLVASDVQQAIDCPLIDIIDETADVLKAAGVRKPLLLATRYTMEHGFYAEKMKAHGIDVMVPDAEGRTLVHDVIFNELCAGLIKEDSRTRLKQLIEQQKALGADAVILGCTEICLILQSRDMDLPCFDSTSIHAAAAVNFALAA